VFQCLLITKNITAAAITAIAKAVAISVLLELDELFESEDVELAGI